MARMRSDVDFIDVKGQSTDAIIESLDLRDYSKVPVAYMDPATNEWRQMADAAVIADPDGHVVSRVVSADYHLHQSRPLLQMIQQFGAESGLELTRIGKSRAGLLAQYTLPSERIGDLAALRVGDTIRSGITLSTGFDGLTATWLRSWFERLVCSNGARALKDGAEFQVRHSARLSDEVLNRAGKALEQVIASTGAYTGWLKGLAEIPVSPAEARAFLRILAYPGTAIRDQAKISGEINWQKLAPVHAELSVASNSAISWGSDDSERFPANQQYRALLDSWQHAPGSAPGSLAGLYHAITHYQSNSASGNRAARTWSVLQDRGSQQIALASTVLDGWATAVRG